MGRRCAKLAGRTGADSVPHKQQSRLPTHTPVGRLYLRGVRAPILWPWPDNNRLDLPGIPQHVVRRGNNRLPWLLDQAERHRCLHLLNEVLLATGSKLHAYGLMGNHVHLLITPPEMDAVASLVQKLGRGYVGQFNARHRRTGTLWEGRRCLSACVRTHLTPYAVNPIATHHRRSLCAVSKLDRVLASSHLGVISRARRPSCQRPSCRSARAR